MGPGDGGIPGAVKRVRSIRDAAAEVKLDIIALGHGDAVAGQDDAQHSLEHAAGIAGSPGASSAERRSGGSEIAGKQGKKRSRGSRARRQPRSSECRMPGALVGVGSRTRRKQRCP